MANVYCDVCGFKFSVKKGKRMPEKCPYCNRAGTIKPVKKAQEWLDEVITTN